MLKRKILQSTVYNVQNGYLRNYKNPFIKTNFFKKYRVIIIVKTTLQL